MNMPQGNSKKKILYLEVVRIFALFCIMFNHTGPRGDCSFAYTDSRINFFLSLVCAILCKVGVPLFWMISGALLLGRQEPFQTVYKRRIPRIAGALVLFSLIRYLYECFWIHSYSFSVRGFLRMLVTNTLFTPYWFLYAYLGVLFILPFVRKMVQHLTLGESRLFLILEGIFLILLPTLRFVFDMDIALQFLFGEYICYLVTGYILENVVFQNGCSKRGVALAFGAGLISLSLMYIFSVKYGVTTGVGTHIYSEIYAFPLTVSIFFLFQSMARFIPQRFSGFFFTCGSCVFGVYLIEDYLRNGLAFIWERTSVYISPIPACVVWLTAVFFTGIFLVYFLKKLPILRNIL